MRKKIYMASLVVIAVMALYGCKKTSPKSTEATTTTEATTAAELTTAAPETTTAASEATTAAEPNDKNTTSEKKAEATTQKSTTEVDAPKVTKNTKGSGIYNGFADSHSIEIQMDDGSYETFFVYDEKLQKKLEKLDEGDKIKFTYGPLEGQINPELKSLD